MEENGPGLLDGRLKKLFRRITRFTPAVFLGNPFQWTSCRFVRFARPNGYIRSRLPPPNGNSIYPFRSNDRTVQTYPSAFSSLQKNKTSAEPDVARLIRNKKNLNRKKYKNCTFHRVRFLLSYNEIIFPSPSIFLRQKPKKCFFLQNQSQFSSTASSIKILYYYTIR